jgi:hypothetical protein
MLAVDPDSIGQGGMLGKSADEALGLALVRGIENDSARNCRTRYFCRFGLSHNEAGRRTSATSPFSNQHRDLPKTMSPRNGCWSPASTG